MLSLLLVTVLAADVHVNPFMAIPITDEFLNHPVIRGFSFDLLRQGGFGRWETERAAFLVLEENGQYRCVAWPWSGGIHRQEFRGSIPDRTVAIIHTHPKYMPLGSAGDQRTARMLSVPIFVLTPTNIYLVTTAGKNVPVVSNRLWKPVNRSSSTRCIAPDSRASRPQTD